MNPRTCGPADDAEDSTAAQIRAASAVDPPEIHILEPLIIQSPPSRRARVRIADGSEPASASVRPKHPMISPAAIPGNHSRFCSSDPYCQMGNITSDPCTETKLRTPESPASNSRQASP